MACGTATNGFRKKWTEAGCGKIDKRENRQTSGQRQEISAEDKKYDTEKVRLQIWTEQGPWGKWRKRRPPGGQGCAGTVGFLQQAGSAYKDTSTR